MNEADLERAAGMSDAIAIALHRGSGANFSWSLQVLGARLDCEYWDGPANETTVRVAVYLAAPEKVTGQDCWTYQDGIDKDGRQHGPITQFKVEVISAKDGPDEGRPFGTPSNSPFSLVDSNLALLCDYDRYFEWMADSGRCVRSGPFVWLKPETAKAVAESWAKEMESRGFGWRAQQVLASE